MDSPSKTEQGTGDVKHDRLLDSEEDSSVQSPPTNEGSIGATRSVTFSAELEEVRLGLDEEPSNTERFTDYTPITDEDLILAKTLVIDAKEGRHSDYEVDANSVRLYILYHNKWLTLLLYIFILLHHGIAIFEEPAVEGWLLPYWATMCLEAACLLYYLIRLIHCASFLPPDKFWRDKKHIIVLSIMFLTIIDIACYTGLMNTGFGHYAYRWSRPLRPVFMVNLSENKQVRRAFRNIRKTLPDILNVLILFFLSISLFALMAQKLFRKRTLKFPNGQDYFTNYLDIYFDLYVLVTTANNPDVMMPAYDFNRGFALFFIAYLVICLYIFMNIFLAVVYNNYRKHLKNEVKKIVYMKRKSLARAYDILKVKVGVKFSVTYHRFCVLMKAIFPEHSPMMTSIFWFVLDSEGNNTVGKADFLQLADLLNVGVSEIKDRITVFEQFLPNCYNSRPSKLFRTVVAHKFFRYFFDIMILLNAFLIAFDKSDAEWFFLVLFSFEIIVKIYTFGITFFFKRFWNVFDFIVIGAAVIATALESFLDKDVEDRTRTLDFLLVLRVLRLVKIIGGIERSQCQTSRHGKTRKCTRQLFRVIPTLISGTCPNFTMLQLPLMRQVPLMRVGITRNSCLVIVVTIMNLGPSILTYGGVLFVVYYIFAVIGMELFKYRVTYHGYGNLNDTSKLYCGNTALKGSAFYQSQYCSNNFNNVLTSFVVLFELMVVNQWHVLTNGFVLVTSKAARLYFFLFHLACVIIVLNIFTAFVLEAFILEYSFCKSKLENAIEQKIMEMGLRLGRSKSKTSLKSDEDQLVEEPGSEAFDSDHDYSAEDEEPQQNRIYGLPDLSQKTDIRFHISKNKNVENLLQRMFEDELDVDDVGPDDIESVGENDDHPSPAESRNAV